MSSPVRALEGEGVVGLQNHDPQNVCAGRDSRRKDRHPLRGGAFELKHRRVVAVPGQSCIHEPDQFGGQEGEVDQAELLDADQRDPNLHVDHAQTLTKEAVKDGAGGDLTVVIKDVRPTLGRQNAFLILERFVGIASDEGLVT